MERLPLFTLFLAATFSNEVFANPCSDNKGATAVYDKAVKILKIPKNEFPPISFNFKKLKTDSILSCLKTFVRTYEDQKGSSCPEDLLENFTSESASYLPEKDPKNWKELPAKVREVLEDIFEAAEIWNRGLNPGGNYCKTLVERMEEAGKNALPLATIDHSKCPPRIQQLALALNAFVKKFEATEKMSCKLADTLWNSYEILSHKALSSGIESDWAKVPQDQRQQMQKWFLNAKDLENDLEEIEAAERQE